MNIKQFHMKYLWALIRPEMFLLPYGKKKNNQVNIHKASPLYYDVLNQTWVKDPMQYINTTGLVVIKDSSGKIVHVTPHSTSDYNGGFLWNETIELPSGNYSIKYVLASENISADWTPFTVNGDTTVVLFTDPLPPIVMEQTLVECNESIDVPIVGEPIPGTTISLTLRSKVQSRTYVTGESETLLSYNERVIYPFAMQYYTGATTKYVAINSGNEYYKYKEDKVLERNSFAFKHPFEITRNNTGSVNSSPYFRLSAYSDFTLSINIPSCISYQIETDNALDNVYQRGCPIFDTVSDTDNSVVQPFFDLRGRFVNGGWVSGIFQNGLVDLYAATVLGNIMISTDSMNTLKDKWRIRKTSSTNISTGSKDAGAVMCHISQTGNGYDTAIVKTNEVYPYTVIDESVPAQIGSRFIASAVNKFPKAFETRVTSTRTDSRNTCCYYSKDGEFNDVQVWTPDGIYDPNVFIHNFSSFGTNSPIFTYYIVTDYAARHDTNHDIDTVRLLYHWDRTHAEKTCNDLNGKTINGVTHDTQLTDTIIYSLPDINYNLLVDETKWMPNIISGMPWLINQLSRSTNMRLKINDSLSSRSGVFMEGNNQFLVYYRRFTPTLSEDYDELLENIWR